MNIRDLQYLLAVHDLRHFGKAAEATCVSQPALSMQIKKLEDELGVQIFERTPGHILTTEMGERIITLARDIVQKAHDIHEIAKASQHPFSGIIKIGAFPTVASYLLPKVIPVIKKQFPDLVPLLLEEKTDVLMSKLISGEIDAAFLALPVNQKGLSERFLFHDPFYLAVSDQHPLSHRKRITIKELEQESLLLLEEGHCLRTQVLEFCSKDQSSEHAAFRATSLETLRHMVALNVGITLMPKIAIRENDGIAYIPFAKPMPSRDIGLVFRHSSVRLACIHAIADCIISGDQQVSV